MLVRCPLKPTWIKAEIQREKRMQSYRVLQSQFRYSCAFNPFVPGAQKNVCQKRHWTASPAILSGPMRERDCTGIFSDQMLHGIGRTSWRLKSKSRLCLFSQSSTMID